jgi:hypothetical protein
MIAARRPLPRDRRGKGRIVRELLAGRKYSIDYYQHEYKWQTSVSPAQACRPTSPADNPDDWLKELLEVDC